jgi:hypothetical protein
VNWVEVITFAALATVVLGLPVGWIHAFWRRRQRESLVRCWADEHGYAIIGLDSLSGMFWLLGVYVILVRKLFRPGFRVSVEDEEGGFLDFDITFRGKRMEVRQVS